MVGAGIDLRRGGAVALAFAVGCLILAVATTPGAAQPGRLHQTSDAGARRSDPPAGRWQADPGDAFILDRSNARPLLRFDSSPEIWVLQVVPAPRGDVIYKNDSGRSMLRATMVGGMTLFTPQRPAGSAAAYAGAAPPLRFMQPLGPTGLFRVLAQSSVRASRAAQHLIGMDTEWDADSAWLQADAAVVAAEAFVRMAEMPNGRRLMARVASITIVAGARPGARLAGGTLTLTITPRMGIAGRPSSDRIIQAIGR
jgi:hypothetical protein